MHVSSQVVQRRLARRRACGLVPNGVACPDVQLKQVLTATLWDLRSEIEEGHRAITSAQRALDGWTPDVSREEDQTALRLIRGCFSTIEENTRSAIGILKQANSDLAKSVDQPARKSVQRSRGAKGP